MSGRFCLKRFASTTISDSAQKWYEANSEGIIEVCFVESLNTYSQIELGQTRKSMERN